VKSLPQAAKELSEIEARKAKAALIINWTQSDHRNAAVKDGTSNTFLMGNR
jgi:hypothetical protein